MRRMERAEYKADLLPLADNYEKQENDFFCGVASSVAVLNALHATDSHASRYTQDTFFDADTDRVKTRSEVLGKPKDGARPDYGFQIAQLQKMLEAHHLKAGLRVVTNELSEDAIRAEFIKNLGQKDDFILVNYYRPALGQPGGGHISPLGAYDKESDSVLIMDVNPDVAQWVWVKIHPHLIDSPIHRC